MRIAHRLITVLVLMWFALPAWASSDPYFANQWGLSKIKAEQAWATGRGGGVTVAVVDTGVDADHEDLGVKVVAGFDFVNSDRNPQDGHGHGTHVAGIAAAITDNGKGVAGTAPNACIMPIRVLDNDGSGISDNVRAGIRWAADRGAQVINLSLGDIVVIRNIDESNIKDAIEYAWSKGVVVVIAAGNDVLFPNGYRDIHALVVGASDSSDQKAYYSNLSDASWSLVAPGSGIYSTLPGNAYGQESGTSMAAPHVAGAAAVLRGLGKSAQETVDLLLKSADDLGPNGTDPIFGHGRLNLARAVQGLAPNQSGINCASASGGSAGGGGTAPGGSARTPGSSSGGSSSAGGGAAKADGSGAAGGGLTGGAETTESRSGGESAAAEPSDDEKGLGSPVANVVIGGILLAGIIGAYVWARVKTSRARAD